MALAPLAYVLYTRVMRHDADATRTGPTATASCSPAATRRCCCTRCCYLTGYDLTLDDLKRFRQLGSPAAGHPEYGHAAGHRDHHRPARPGHLAPPSAWRSAERMLAARFNRDGHEIVDHHTYVDRLRRRPRGGHRLRGVLARRPPRPRPADRLLRRQPHLDRGRHRRSRSPRTSASATRPTAGTSRTSDEDIDLDAARAGRSRPRRRSSRPPEPDHRPHAHRARLAEQAGHARRARLAARRGGDPAHQGGLRLARATSRSSSRTRRSRTSARRSTAAASSTRRVAASASSAYRASTPSWPRSSSASSPRRCPTAGTPTCRSKGPDAGMIATRKASQEVIQWAAAQVPELVGGSADLAPSTLTLIDGGGSVEAGEYGGRNLHFGIREHAHGRDRQRPGAVSGFRAFGAGVPDLQRLHEGRRSGSPRSCASRRSSCSRTTRSALGEDGPTHQPIEQLATLRATPNIDVVRPARLQRDRARLAARAAARRDRPTVLALSRQGLPVWDPAGVPDDAIERGAYVLHGQRAASPTLILMAPAPRSTSRTTRPKLLEAEGVARAARVACRAWTASPSRTRRTATACCRPRSARAWRSRRRARSAGTAGSATTATSSRWRASAPRRRRRCCTSTSASRGEAIARARAANVLRARRRGHERHPHVNERLAALTAAGRASGSTRSAAA